MAVVLRRRLNLPNIALFSALTLLTVVGAPWYALRVGVAPVEWALCGVLVLATGLSITVGYHRLFAHRAFQASPLITFLSLAFGAAAFELSALAWTSLHRDHHQYVDTERDPYNIKQGFWYAHIGWMVFWWHECDFENVKDLAADRLIAHQHAHYVWWALVFGVGVPLAVGALIGHLLGALLLLVAARLTLVHHSTWAINSVCHTFGKATYDVDASARDHWLVALITNGEGFHNFHHRFPCDYRNGIRWYHWDPSKWFIAACSWCGLTAKLYRTSPQTILAARLAGQQCRLERQLLAHTAARPAHPRYTAALDALRERYQRLKTALYEWEHSEQAYQRMLRAASERSRLSIQHLQRQIRERRTAFQEARREWTHCLRTLPLAPGLALA